MSRPPRATGIRRVYMVHTGQIRGWSTYRETVYRRAGEVRDPAGGYWPEGWYIVRDPDWHVLRRPLPMPGFRGVRYLDRPPGPPNG